MDKRQATDVEAMAVEIRARLRASPVRNVPQVRAIRREFSRQLVKAPAEVVVALADKLLDGDGGMPRFLAYELLCKHPAALRSLGRAELKRLGRGIASWGDVDCFATYLAGPAWREQQVPNSLIQRWARSPDRWWRRTALVCTVALNNRALGGRGDTPRTLDICCRLIADRDDMVVKALSWALRALARRDPDAVRDFLAEQQDELASRVRRETMNKLATGLKNPRKNK